MLSALKKKVEELNILNKWFEKNEDHVIVELVESETYTMNGRRVYKVYSPTDENLYFIISHEDDSYQILNISGIEATGRYTQRELQHLMLQFFKKIERRHEVLMDVNEGIEGAISLFKIDD